MNPITPSASTPAPTGSSSSTPVNPSTKLDQNTFLKLMMVQLQNQDPLNPSDPTQYEYEGSTSRTTVDILFPESVVPGTQVWLTAFWFNGRKQSGPAATPVSTNVQGGGVSLAA